jgi:NDP-sugar pyrophosphorylase family protein
VIRPISCVILAGGKGTRALATGDRTPKVLRRVGAGESALTNAVNRALAVAAEVIVAIGPMRTLLTTALPSTDRLIVVEDLGLGNGGALVSAACSASYDHILVINADTINDVPYGSFIDSHLVRGIGSSILLTRCQEAQNPGAYVVRRDGIVVRSLEDGRQSEYCVPPQCWRGASTGVLLFPTRELRLISILETAIVERGITPAFIARQLLWAFDAGDSLSLDLGTPKRIALAHLLPRSAYLRRD